MALIKDQKTRYDIPHEEGQWIELRPLRNSDLIGIDDDDPYASMIATLEKIIVAWSYDEPVTPETVRLLDMRTTNWLGLVLKESMGDLTAKNGYTTSS